MTKAQRKSLEDHLGKLVAARRQQGSFDVNSEALLLLAEATLLILQSLPKPRK